MRNPLLNNEGRHDADLRALEPVPERYVGQNNPYRGTEQHGVASPHDPHDVPGYGDTYAVELDEEKPRQDPVPVYIVNQTAREQKDWAPAKWPITNRPDPVRIAGTDERRLTLKIRNDGPDSVYLARTPESATDAFGWELEADSEIDLSVHTEVWVNVQYLDNTGALTEDTAVVYTLVTFAESLPNR
jgi:hypothetical protein